MDTMQFYVIQIGLEILVFSGPIEQFGIHE